MQAGITSSGSLTKMELSLCTNILESVIIFMAQRPCLFYYCNEVMDKMIHTCYFVAPRAVPKSNHTCCLLPCGSVIWALLSCYWLCGSNLLMNITESLKRTDTPESPAQGITLNLQQIVSLSIQYNVAKGGWMEP